MKTLSLSEINALAKWLIKNQDINWGSWDARPSLSVGATYLSYDTNLLQINFDEPVNIGPHSNIVCISASRRIVGKKYQGTEFLYPSDVIALI